MTTAASAFEFSDSTVSAACTPTDAAKEATLGSCITGTRGTPSAAANNRSGAPVTSARVG